MGLFDGFVGVLVILGVAFLIYAKIANKNPALKEKMKGIMDGDKKEKLNKMEEKIEQVYDEKRSMM